MIELFARHLIPAAYAVLPPMMNSPKATAQLLAIGLQESKFLERRQVGGGPARGMFQFERGGGIRGVVTHEDTRDFLRSALTQLRYEREVGQTLLLYNAVEHNDVLAVVFARLLLWTLPAPLPARDKPADAWKQYLDAWRPGAPHRSTWDGNFALAWSIVDPPVVTRNGGVS